MRNQCVIRNTGCFRCASDEPDWEALFFQLSAAPIRQQLYQQKASCQNGQHQKVHHDFSLLCVSAAPRKPCHPAESRCNLFRYGTFRAVCFADCSSFNTLFYRNQLVFSNINAVLTQGLSFLFDLCKMSITGEFFVCFSHFKEGKPFPEKDGAAESIPLQCYVRIFMQTYGKVSKMRKTEQSGRIFMINTILSEKKCLQ